MYVCVCLYVEETRKGQRLRGRAGSHSTRGTGKRETRKASKIEPTVSTSRNGMNCTQRHEREVGPSIGRPASPSNPTACVCVCVCGDVYAACSLGLTTGMANTKQGATGEGRFVYI